jgi:hypothetical protein
MKWEYLVQELPASGVADWLNDCGDAGWELIAFYSSPATQGTAAIFKKPVPELKGE